MNSERSTKWPVFTLAGLITLLLAVGASAVLGVNLLGPINDSTKDHVLEGLAVVPTALGAALVAVSFVLRQFDAALAVEVLIAEDQVLRNTAASSKIDPKSKQETAEQHLARLRAVVAGFETAGALYLFVGASFALYFWGEGV